MKEIHGHSNSWPRSIRLDFDIWINMNPLSSVALLTPYVESLRRHSEMLRSAQLSPIGNGQVQSFTVVKTIWVWNQTSRKSFVFWCHSVFGNILKVTFFCNHVLRTLCILCILQYIYKHDATHNLYKGLRHTCKINLQNATTRCKYQWIMRRYPSWEILNINDDIYIHVYIYIFLFV